MNREFTDNQSMQSHINKKVFDLFNTLINSNEGLSLEGTQEVLGGFGDILKHLSAWVDTNYLSEDLFYLGLVLGWLDYDTDGDCVPSDASENIRCTDKFKKAWEAFLNS
jgi:hypothetical protein